MQRATICGGHQKRSLGVALLALLTVAALGCDFKKTFTDSDASAYSFEYPASYAHDSHSEGIPGAQGVWLYVGAAQGSGTVKTFCVYRYAGLLKTATDDTKPVILQSTMTLLGQQMQGPATLTFADKTRPYATTQRALFSGKSPWNENTILMEGFVHGEDLYILMATGNSQAIDADADGEHFYQTFKVLK